MNSRSKSTYTWRFPLPRTHTGILMGNGLMGVMVWGGKNVLNITVSRSDFWDHRGGTKWSKEQSFSNIRECLENGDEKRLRELFEQTPPKEGEPRRPTVMPFGRLEIMFTDGCEILEGKLHLASGTVEVAVNDGSTVCTLELCIDMDHPVLGIKHPTGLKVKEIRRVTSWDSLGDYFATISIKQPQMFEKDNTAGWIQALPADPALCIAYSQPMTLEPGTIFIATAQGETGDEAFAHARGLISAASAGGCSNLVKNATSWWQGYWEDVPVVNIPNPKLQFLYDYGMYKFAGLTNPSGFPAGLQGPWIEEDRLPPWSSDYHFNINVQMCYWPAYRGNRLGHLKPLWEMISSWKDTLKKHAKLFTGIDDGLMLPHAVDDRCTIMGGFWTGSIDHGCTAWMAQLMFRQFEYSKDVEFLRHTAYPFMKGAMRVYEEMLQKEGEAYVLPVSVSPEYMGSRMDAWGRNASFQLAAIHRLLEDLDEAARILGEEPSPLWSEIKEKLPIAALGEWDGPRTAVLSSGRKFNRILLWEGQPLEESHRHHSHMAGIYPFDVIDMRNPKWAEIIENTVNEWIFRGTGLWSGWCIPWAAILHTCFGNGDMAEYLLETFDRVYTNEGHGTLHDCNFPGFSLIGGLASSGKGTAERMQMDGGMACVMAVQEMLLHTARGINYIFRGVPEHWKEASFEGMRTEGAFLVSASMDHGIVRFVDVRSEKRGTFRLANPWQGSAEVIREDGSVEIVSGEVLTVYCEPGETFRLELRKKI